MPVSWKEKENREPGMGDFLKDGGPISFLSTFHWEDPVIRHVTAGGVRNAVHLCAQEGRVDFSILVY